VLFASATIKKAKGNATPMALFFFMAKDPAVLFYTNDFLSGTFTMTNEQVGMYIRLLCLQHQKGPLTEKDMLNICKTYDEDIWEKFENIDGRFVNRRMLDESEKRSKFADSRRKNRQKKTHDDHMLNTCKTYDEHMENENENEIEDVIVLNKKKVSKFQIPTIDEIIFYFAEIGNQTEGQRFFDYYTSNGWMVGKNKMKDWKAAARNWMNNTKKYQNAKQSDFEKRIENHNQSIQWAIELDRSRGINVDPRQE
jgi:hypothetical protein